MTKEGKWYLLFLIIFSFTTSYGQGFSPYYTNSTYQKYLNYLIYSGKIKVNHPLSQPYGLEQLSDSLPEDTSSHIPAPSTLRPSGWLPLLKYDIRKRYGPVGKKDSLNDNFTFGAEAGNRNNYRNKENSNYFSGGGFASYSFGNFGLYSNIRVDEEFRKDTLYFGSTGKLEKMVIARSDETYAGWENKNFTVFAGRISRNFGIPGETSLVLSNETFSFDHLALSFSNRALKYIWLFGRLNDVYGFDIRDSLPKYQWSKRFLAIHRFEIALSKKLEIAFTDVILFGGKDPFPQFQYLNPVNFLFISKMSDRKGYEEGTANALMCFDIFFKPSDRLTLFGQLLIDDIDFTKSLRAIYPDRVGYSGKIIYSDLIPASQFYLSYNRISNWTYTSFYTWGNYTYYGKSLGYPLNGAEIIKFGFETYKHYPFMLGLEFMAGENRIQNMNAAFVAVKTGFPIGTAQKSAGLKFNATFIPNSLISANISTEYIRFNNYGHVNSRRQSFFNIFLSLKIQGIFRLF